jgi:putative serine protease PepD
VTNQTPNSSSQFVFDSARYVAQPAAPAKPQPTQVRNSRLIAIVAGCSLLGAALGGGAVAAASLVLSGPAKQTVIVNNSNAVNWVTAVAQKAEPSVVTISVSDSSGDAGSGSGIVLSADGFILTNNHVVTLEGITGSPNIDVKTADGKVYAAKLVGTDPTNDLAVIRIRPIGGLTPATFSNSDNVNVGDDVVAIGSPLGLDATVTSGIISALDRTIQVANSAAPESSSGGGLHFLQGGSSSSSAINLTVIQTDAAINPGNSGGALVNQNGEVIGVNVAIASAGASTGSQTGSIGVGFSIPANNALRIAKEIMKTGKASHAMLGAYLSDYYTTASAGFSTGAKVVKLMPGAPAEKAGLQLGDVVIAFNGQTVSDASQLTADVRLEAAGTRIELQVIRAGKTITIPVVLGNADNLK